MQFTAQLSDQWTVWGSHAIQEAKVVKAFDASGKSLAGKEVFSTPRYISNLGVDYRWIDDWRFGMQPRAQGLLLIDTTNKAGKYGGFALLDANVSYRLSASTSIDLQVNNLTDREYEYVWYDNFFGGATNRLCFHQPQVARHMYRST